MRKQYVRQLHEHGNTCADMKCIAVYPASDVAELESRAVDQALRIRELEQSLRWVLDNGVIWHSGDFAAPVYDELKGVKSPDDVYELVSSLMDSKT